MGPLSETQTAFFDPIESGEKEHDSFVQGGF